ncbi:hypothetical protein IWW57_002052 [Coemansia sp. S610]|nr:hypothetical protein IWW57_002052 [Coemansia sp. S610]
MPPMAFQSRGPPPPIHHYPHSLPPPPHHYAQPPETPTAGLTAAFSSLGTEHTTHGVSYSRAVPPPVHRPHSNPVHGPIRLPPIQSFDHQQPPLPRITTPPRSSSWLNVLTDAALDEERIRRPVMGPFPVPPPHERRAQSPSDVQQSSSPQLGQGAEDSRHNTASESERGEKRDVAMNARVRKLSRALRSTHINHEMTPE